MKAAMRDVTITENNETLVNFAQTVDFTELFEHIVNFTGINGTFDQPEISTNRHGEVYIDFQSEDVAGQTGPFAAILKRCYIHSFSGGVNRDKNTGEPFYWVSVNIRYEHNTGGSNGMDICRARYTESKGWDVMDADGR